LERQRSQEADSHSSKKQLADEQREMGQVRDDATQVRLELEKLEPLRECQPPPYQWSRLLRRQDLSASLSLPCRLWNKL
jgi:hypothetical protein